MTGKDKHTSEDKLLDLPADDDPESASERSNLRYQRQLDEFNQELAGDALPRMLFPWTSPHEKQQLEEQHRRQQLAYEQQLREIAERQDHLLQEIEQEQVRIEERRRDIDDHALRLSDGRLAYVDGDRYRDGEGRVLTGADEAEAARQHEYRPDASTWAQKQEIERRAAEAQKLKEKIEQDRANGGAAPEQDAQKLDGYEKEFAEKIEAKTATPVAAYSSTDYMDYQLSSAPAFNQAAGDAQAEPAAKPDGDESAETKRAPQPVGQGTPFKHA